MKDAVEIVVNSWIYGVPLVLLVWAALRLLHTAPGRLRYVLTIVAFVAGIVVPLVDFRALPAESGGGASSLQSAPRGDRAMDVVAAVTLPLTALWIVGAVVLLLRELAGHLRLRRARRSWEEAPTEMRQLLEWPEHLPLAVSRDTSPFTTGLGSPLVVLPRDIAAAFPLPVARRIALHELSHCRWRDPLVYAAMRVVVSLFWISPLWLLLRWTRREREVAADEVALRVVAGDEESYVAALVRLSRLALAHRSAASAMAASDLEFRAGRILAVTRRSSMALSIVVLSGAAALASVVEPVRLPSEVAAIPERAPGAVNVPAVVLPFSDSVIEAPPAPKVRTRVATKPEVEKVTPEREDTEPMEPSPEDDGNIHVDVHVAMDEHVAVDRHVAVPESDVAQAINEVVRDAVRTEVVNHPDHDERNVIRIVNVIRRPDERRPSRWRSFVNAIRDGARDPAPRPE